MDTNKPNYVKIAHNIAKLSYAYFKGKFITIFLLLILIIMFISYIAQPAAIGYSIYRDAIDSNITLSSYIGEVNDVDSKLNEATENLAASKLANDKLMRQAISYKLEIDSTYAKIEDLNKEMVATKKEYDAKLNNANEALSEKEEIISEKESQILILESDYSKFMRYAAVNKCCKEKVDYLTINSYTIENNKIICLESSGKYTFTCYT